MRANLSNLSIIFGSLNRLALYERYSMLALRLAEAMDRPAHVFRARLERFRAIADTAATGRGYTRTARL